MTLRSKLLGAAACLVFYGCGGDGGKSGGSGGNILELTLFGARENWSDVTMIEIDGKEVPDAATNKGGGHVGITLAICTYDRDAFLSDTTISVRVSKTTGQMITSEIERVACRFAPDPGHYEEIHARLEADGTIDSEFGADPEIVTGCSSGGDDWMQCADGHE